MIERRPWADALAHGLLVVAVLVMLFPLWYVFVASTRTAAEILSPPLPLWPGSHGWENWRATLVDGARRIGGIDALRLLANTTLIALAVAAGKIVISFLSAYALVFFRFPLQRTAFALIFVTLMLPVEVRIMPTYQVMVDLGLINTWTGLTLPLMASATATFLFRQCFATIPDELLEAARIDGAGPWRFLRDVVLPLSATNIAALSVIVFIYGWTQYLWPLLMTSSNDMHTLIIALKKMVSFADADTEWPQVMVITLLAMLPPVAVVVVMQRWFVRGLVDGDK